jgi:hypothetical protein
VSPTTRRGSVHGTACAHSPFNLREIRFSALVVASQQFPIVAFSFLCTDEFRMRCRSVRAVPRQLIGDAKGTTHKYAPV